ncbi:MAG: hypothetical protein ABIG87_02705, partial [Patescibacteria group bacterium]
HNTPNFAFIQKTSYFENETKTKYMNAKISFFKRRSVIKKKIDYLNASGNKLFKKENKLFEPAPCFF